MSGHIEYIGRRVIELSRTIFQGIDSLPGNSCPLLEELDVQLDPEENLFIYIGKFLISQTDEYKNKLNTFAELLGYRLITSRATQDQIISVVYRFRLSIFNLLEQELLQKKISIESYFECVKLIESLFQLISSTLLKFYTEEITFMKLALEESKKDLTMTLRELADLERALNEATIFAISDHEDRILHVNDNYCKLFKYSREELIGKNHSIIGSNYHSSEFFHEIWETIQSGEAWKGEIYNQAKDGSKYWLDTTLIPFIDSNGVRYKHISIQYDITEKKNSEETLQKTEKLSMIGELAAGIAHEIRNPLTTIRGFVQLLNNDGIEPYYAETILDEIDRINFIVSELMVFAKPHQIHFSDCNINSILTSVTKFLEPEANLKNVYFESKLPIEDVVISGEKNQLKQVFLNFIKNSMEAMPAGGKIEIMVERTAQNIVVTIKDEGIGMEAAQVKKLGEPFFTTKQEGNGLGLMVSFKIIQNHKGSIHVDSKLNQGTTFTISFKNPANQRIISN